MVRRQRQAIDNLQSLFIRAPRPAQIGSHQAFSLQDPEPAAQDPEDHDHGK